METNQKTEKQTPQIQPKDQRWKIEIQTEKITLELPKSVIDFYRIYGKVENKKPEDLLAEDIKAKLKQDFETYDFADFFGLTKIFEQVDN